MNVWQLKEKDKPGQLKDWGKGGLMPKISVEDKVLAILKQKVWVGSDEIEALFPKGEPGHFSWPQRLRGLREQGYTINRRIKAGTKNLSEWHLELPEPPRDEQSEMVAENNLAQETAVNYKEVNKQLVLAI
jgi:hypothetical protein